MSNTAVVFANQSGTGLQARGRSQHVDLAQQQNCNRFNVDKELK